MKSAQMMVETVRDFRQDGVSVPVLVGGAALSNRFTRLRIAPEYDGLVAYAPDAMTGLALANTIQEADERAHLSSQLEAETEAMLDDDVRRAAEETGEDVPPAQVRHDFPIPNPPDLRLHVITDYNLEDIFGYINPQMLYVRHLGYKGRFAEDLEAGEQAALDLRDSVRRVEDLMLARKRHYGQRGVQVLPVPGRWPMASDLLPRRVEVLERFYFGRQSQRDGLCLSDYVLPGAAAPGSGLDGMDYVGMFVTSVGPGVRDLAARWIAEGKFLDSHVLQALALESAEGFAELLHQQLRQMWGFGDPAGITPYELFRTQYRGRRFSFGYPACPRLEDQEQLFRLLEVSNHLDVELTEGHMMDPESTVSALVMHHPDAKYFNLSEQDINRLESELGG